MAGSLRFLAPDLKTTLAQIDLVGVGIFRLATDDAPTAAAADAVATVVADLYCERMQLSVAT